MNAGTIVAFLFLGIIAAGIIGSVVYYIYFSSRVTQRIRRTNADHDKMEIITEVFYYDKVIKKYITLCHYNDAGFDGKAKADKELAEIYLERYKKYGTSS